MDLKTKKWPVEEYVWREAYSRRLRAVKKAFDPLQLLGRNLFP
jgi:hypothetical protein